MAQKSLTPEQMEKRVARFNKLESYQKQNFDAHNIPPAPSRALGGLVGTEDYTELALPGGHVGVFVGGKSQGLFAPGVAEWLAKRE